LDHNSTNGNIDEINELIDSYSIESLEKCLQCDKKIKDSELYSTYKICHNCNFHFYIKPYERINLLTDRESYVEFNQELPNEFNYIYDKYPDYAKRAQKDTERTGLNDSVLTGYASIGGNRCILIILDFSFMGGNLGLISGEKISLAIDLAVSKKLPIVSIISSSGTRLEEGMISIMQMAKITLSMANAKKSNIPSISLLTNPCTGQAYATLATFSDIIMSEPGASVGLSPLKDLKHSSGSVKFESRTSDSLVSRGLIDSIVNRNYQKEEISRIIDLLNNRHKLVYESKNEKVNDFALSDIPIDKREYISQHPSRPSASLFLNKVFEHFFELKGDRLLENSERIVTGLAQLGGQTVMLVAQEYIKDASSSIGKYGLTSTDFRKCTRAISMASRFNIPIITFIDTKGHDLSYEEEIKGIGVSLGGTLLSMAELNSPSMSVLIGVGGSEAALSLDISDRRLMLENAILKIPDNNLEINKKNMILGSRECKELDIVDIIVPEPIGGLHLNPDECFSLLRKVLMIELAELNQMSSRSRFRSKYNKFRGIPGFSNNMLTDLTNDVLSVKSKLTNYLNIKLGKNKSSKKS
jgi:acetyl-CoA carboxylase carboxyl transferase subunit beta